MHGNGTLHPVLELAARETPLRLSPEDTVVLRYHVLLEEIIERNSETFTETWNRFITHTEHLDLDFNSVFLEIFHRGDPSLGRALAWMAWCMHGSLRCPQAPVRGDWGNKLANTEGGNNPPQNRTQT